QRFPRTSDPQSPPSATSTECIAGTSGSSRRSSHAPANSASPRWRSPSTRIDAVLILPFTTELSRMSARTFATDVLQRILHVTELHEGENFRFGYQAQAGIESLEALGRELGFTVRVYRPRSIRGHAISSSTIRQLIADGDVNRVRALLKRPFAITGTPASGRGYGTRYTVPTINLAPYAELLPANGVYITTLAIGAGGSAETFDAVTNVGN